MFPEIIILFFSYQSFFSDPWYGHTQRQSLLNDPVNLTECFKDPSYTLKKNGFKVLVLAVFCLGIFPFVVSSDHCDCVKRI